MTRSNEGRAVKWSRWTGIAVREVVAALALGRVVAVHLRTHEGTHVIACAEWPEGALLEMTDPVRKPRVFLTDSLANAKAAHMRLFGQAAERARKRGVRAAAVLAEPQAELPEVESPDRRGV